MRRLSVTIGLLYESVKNHDIKLIAGEKGLSKAVKWVHMVENIEIATFLEGGEVTFSTGIGLSNEFELINLIEGIIKSKASGIVINIGPYIKKIDKKCIDYCNETNTPLFVVPWHVHMAEIMRVFCIKITENEKNSLEISTSIQNAIFYHEREDLYLSQLEIHGFKSENKYCIAVFDVNKFDMINDEKYIIRLNECIENYLSVYYKQAVCVRINNQLIFLFMNTTESKVLEILQKIVKHCESKHLIKSIFIGIGKETKSIRCIYKSYRQADSVVIINKKKYNNDICRYDDIGIYKLLFAIQDRNVIRSFIDETIGKVIEYDSYNNTDYFTVLRCYLSYNGSLQDTANELYIHRNTVNYKIKKSEEILNVDLSKLEIREMIDIAYKLHDIL
ncbi:PucR family transcriptional regulator [Clostridium butyricum]|uniref:PucR family transcriptional regulator n=1 Tax=Clostridium butyricum TaxID=1492 RepID=UPI00374F44C8